MEYQAKLNEKYMAVLHCHQGTFYKNLQDTATSSFISCFLYQLLHQQISFFTNFYNLKKFAFFNGFIQTPHPLNPNLVGSLGDRFEVGVKLPPPPSLSKTC